MVSDIPESKLQLQRLVQVLLALDPLVLLQVLHQQPQRKHG